MAGLKSITHPTEHDEQVRLIRWCKEHQKLLPQLALIFAIPNGGKRKTGGWMVAEGLKSGVPDLFLPVARQGKHGFFIEMKREKGGEVSENQRLWIEALREQGYEAQVCYGWDDAADRLLKYLTK
jgi:hypothetical protein